MVAVKQTTTLKQAIDKVIAKMTGVVSRKEVVEAVLKYYPSKAKNPASSIATELRWRQEVVAFGDGYYARADFVLDGAKFRITISERELALGILQPSGFIPFDQALPPATSRFIDRNGEVIPVVKKGIDISRLSKEQIDEMLIEAGESILTDPLQMLAPVLFGNEDEDESESEEDLAEEFNESEQMAILLEDLKENLAAQTVKRHDFSNFFEKYNVQPGDALLVTMKPKEKTYIFEHESSGRSQTALIEAHDDELRQFIHQNIKRSQRESARDVIFRAYGKFPWLKEHTGSHWQKIVEKDNGLRLLKTFGTWEIASIDYRMMFDMIGVDEVTTQKLQKRRMSLEKEVENFLDRFDEAMETFTDELTGKYDEGGRKNVIKKVRIPEDEEKIYAHNEQLIKRFFQEKKIGKEKAASEKVDDISFLANYLANYEGITLEYAEFNLLEEFLFDWYPRKVIGASAVQVNQLAVSIRDFYRFLVKIGIVHSAKFAEAIYNLRNFAGEKIELYDRLPAIDEAENLYGQLFPRW